MANYYFTVQYMSPNPQATPRYTPRGTWLPPKALGNNISRGQLYQFSHDGQGPNTESNARFPRGLKMYKTYSLYYSNGLLFTVPYNAIDTQVHDGDEAPYDDMDQWDNDEDEEEDYRQDWSEIKFGRPPNDTSYWSYAKPGQESLELLAQRNDQNWAHYFLPDRYQAGPRTNNQNYGGLVGELPLLLALVALSMPPQSLGQALPRIVTNPWQLPPQIEAAVPRRSQWQTMKGLVVTVYYDEDETSARELKRYERGDYGPIFP